MGGIGIGNRPRIEEMNRTNRSTTHNRSSTYDLKGLKEAYKHPFNGMARSHRIAGNQGRRSIDDTSEPILHLLLSTLTPLPLL